jgi:hypoxanthine phosphoribosyltransferase
VLNSRFNAPDNCEFPLVLGVMGGAVIFTGNLLPQLTFPLEFDYIHVSRYGDDDQGGKVVWKVIPRSNVVGRVVVVLDDILDEGETLAHVKQRLLDMGLDDTGPVRGRVRHGCPWLLAQFAGPVGDQPGRPDAALSITPPPH